MQLIIHTLYKFQWTKEKHDANVKMLGAKELKRKETKR